MLTKTTTLLAKNSNGRLSYIFGRLILVHFFSFRTNFGQISDKSFPYFAITVTMPKQIFGLQIKKKTKKTRN